MRRLYEALRRKVRKTSRGTQNPDGFASTLLGALRDVTDVHDTIQADVSFRGDTHRCVFLKNTHWGYVITSIEMDGPLNRDPKHYEGLLRESYSQPAREGESMEPGPDAVFLEACTNPHFRRVIEKYKAETNRPYLPMRNTEGGE